MNIIENQLLLTFGLLIVTVIIKLVSRKSVNRFLNHFDFDAKRKRIAHRIINLFLFIFITVTLISIWNIDKKDLILLIEERERESQTTSCNNDDDGLKENVLRPSNYVVKFNLTFSGTF